MNERTIRMAEVERAINHFKETHRYDPLAILVHPYRVPLSVPTQLFLYFKGVCIFRDKKVPLSDSAGEILFLLGDCIEPAIRVYADD